LNSNKNFTNQENNRLHEFWQKSGFFIIVLIVIGFLIRLYYFIPDIPVTFDALTHFFYAMDISITNKLPINYSPANNGWPIFLSFFFKIFSFENTLEYMQLQKILTISISTITIIPIYFLSKNFFNKKISVIISSIFIFDPRIIYNSLTGITEPFYILLCTISLVFFLNEKKKYVYFSFFIVALASLIRSEGLFLFFALSVLFFIKFRKERAIIIKYLPALAIVLLILLPMITYRIEAVGYDSLFGRIFDSLDYVFQPLIKTGEIGDDSFGFHSTSKFEPTNSGVPYILAGIENFIKFFAWSLIPIFIFFVPFGFLIFLKKMEIKKMSILISAICLSLPAFHAYGSAHADTRYLFIFYPIYCIISGFTIQKILEITNQKKIVLIIIMITILIGSIGFIEIREMNFDLENEYNVISKKVIVLNAVTNSFYPASNYLETAEIPNDYERLKEYFFKDRQEKISIRDTIPHKTTIIEIEGSELIEYMKNAENKSVTHLIIDLEENRPKFFKNIFEKEDIYPFLEKIYDSKDEGFDYQVKIFKINYDMLENEKK